MENCKSGINIIFKGCKGVPVTVVIQLLSVEQRFTGIKALHIVFIFSIRCKILKLRCFKYNQAFLHVTRQNWQILWFVKWIELIERANMMQHIFGFLILARVAFGENWMVTYTFVSNTSFTKGRPEKYNWLCVWRGSKKV